MIFHAAETETLFASALALATLNLASTGFCGFDADLDFVVGLDFVAGLGFVAGLDFVAAGLGFVVFGLGFFVSAPAVFCQNPCQILCHRLCRCSRFWLAN